MTLVFSKVHLVILPCREGIYNSLLDTNCYEIEGKKHVFVVVLLVFSGMFMCCFWSSYAEMFWVSMISVAIVPVVRAM